MYPLRFGDRVVCIAPCLGKIANSTRQVVIDAGMTGRVRYECPEFEGRVMVEWSTGESWTVDETDIALLPEDGGRSFP